MTDTFIKGENTSKKFCKSLKRSLWYGIQDMTAEITARNYEDTLRPKEFWALEDDFLRAKAQRVPGIDKTERIRKKTYILFLDLYT